MRAKYILMLIFIVVSQCVCANEIISPSSDLVLLTINNSPQNSVIASLRQQLARDKSNTDVAAKLVQHYMDMARQQSNPKYFGYAKAVLTPYILTNTTTDPNLLLHWADILQYLHEFDAALLTLNKVIVAAPNLVRAYLMRSAIHLARGHYAEGLKDCTALIGKTDLLTITTCVSQFKSISGELPESYRLMARLLSAPAYNDKVIYAWVLSVSAEMVRQLGVYT